MKRSLRAGRHKARLHRESKYWNPGPEDRRSLRYSPGFSGYLRVFWNFLRCL